MPAVRHLLAVPFLALTLVAGACSSSDSDTDGAAGTTNPSTSATVAPPSTASASTVPARTVPATTVPATTVPATTEAATTEAPAATSTFRIEVWADNWMAVYVDGALVGEDSVSITTERSFNAETFIFEANYPFTIGIEAKDFKETDSGIEYIGEPNQQMGDGGVIAQVTDLATGEVVAATDGGWRSLVVQRAPLNVECETDPDPDATCRSEAIEAPAEWATPDFDDSTWVEATEWSADDVAPKDGYDLITWTPSARLVWGTDLHVDNTILLRATVTG